MVVTNWLARHQPVSIRHLPLPPIPVVFNSFIPSGFVQCALQLIDFLGYGVSACFSASYPDPPRCREPVEPGKDSIENGFSMRGWVSLKRSSYATFPTMSVRPRKSMPAGAASLRGYRRFFRGAGNRGARGTKAGPYGQIGHCKPDGEISPKGGHRDSSENRKGPR